MLDSKLLRTESLSHTQCDERVTCFIRWRYCRSNILSGIGVLAVPGVNSVCAFIRISRGVKYFWLLDCPRLLCISRSVMECEYMMIEGLADHMLACFTRTIPTAILQIGYIKCPSDAVSVSPRSYLFPASPMFPYNTVITAECAAAWLYLLYRPVS